MFDDVDADGALADEERLADLTVRSAAGELLQDFELAGRQPERPLRGCRCRRGRRVRDLDPGEPGERLDRRCQWGRPELIHIRRG